MLQFRPLTGRPVTVLTSSPSTILRPVGSLDLQSQGTSAGPQYSLESAKAFGDYTQGHVLYDLECARLSQAAEITCYAACLLAFLDHFTCIQAIAALYVAFKPQDNPDEAIHRLTQQFYLQSRISLTKKLIKTKEEIKRLQRENDWLQSRIMKIQPSASKPALQHLSLPDCSQLSQKKT